MGRRGPRPASESPAGVAECEGIPGPCKRCGRCGEYWPLTPVYWYPLNPARKRGVWQSWCRACFTEAARINTARRKKKGGV